MKLRLLQTPAPDPRPFHGQSRRSPPKEPVPGRRKAIGILTNEAKAPLDRYSSAPIAPRVHGAAKGVKQSEA